MGASAEGTELVDRVRMGAGEAPELVGAVRALLTGHPALGGGAGLGLRIVGPAELAADGPRLLRRHRLRDPAVPMVVIYGPDTPVEALRDCFREGARDAIPADAVDTELPRCVDRILHQDRAGRDERDEAQALAAELGKHARDLQDALEALRESYDQTLAALVAALDCREHETAFHSQRVAAYSVMVGVRMGFDEGALENLYRGALLHDIGKIGIPDAVLLKPGSFTPEEWEVMRTHTRIGGEILEGIGFLESASAVPLCHHEAWDGSGYPAGLLGEDIPIDARIFAVVDSYDAIRSERPYKAAKPHGEALRLLGIASGKRLDPRVVDTFCAEPEATWAELERGLTDSITFESCLGQCRAVSDARGGPRAGAETEEGSDVS